MLTTFFGRKHTMSLISNTKIDYAYLIKKFSNKRGMVTVKNMSFEDCAFSGPWLALPLSCNLTHCKLNRQGTSITISGAFNATGIFVFDSCLFSNCTFDLVQFIGDEQLINQIPEQSK